ncbi:hypothetical protein [Nitrosospira lacus]|nr:hypothetical protein [Nitrosospira lacus]
MRMSAALFLVGLAGCSTTPSTYYGEYTRGGERVPYMAALKECRVVARNQANKDNYADTGTAVWLSYVDEYVLACMNEKGFELVNRTLPSKAFPAWGD